MVDQAGETQLQQTTDNRTEQVNIGIDDCISTEDFNEVARYMCESRQAKKLIKYSKRSIYDIHSTVATQLHKKH